MADPFDSRPDRTEARFDCRGHAVGRMRNEMVVDIVTPFEASFELASDERAFHGGEATAPPPLALFVAVLTGCLMTQTRAFAKRLDVTIDDLDVEARVVWEWVKTGRVYETGPKSFDIDVTLSSPDPMERQLALIEAAKKGCFIEQTLGQANVINHRLRTDAGYVSV